MDRFIEEPHRDILPPPSALKSNMDRFIVAELNEEPVPDWL